MAFGSFERNRDAALTSAEKGSPLRSRFILSGDGDFFVFAIHR